MIPVSRRSFQELSRGGLRVPVALRIPLEADAQTVYRAARFQGLSVLLESARTHPVTGRYSILAGEPDFTLVARGGRAELHDRNGVRFLSQEPLDAFDRLMDGWKTARVPGMPPFVGGAVGYLGYDACRMLEPLPSHALNDLDLPDLAFLFCSQTLVLDHSEGQLWSVALSNPQDHDRAYDEALARAEALLQRAVCSTLPEEESVPAAEGFPVSTHTRASFESMVRRAQAYIAAGDIYQANLSQRFDLPLTGTPWDLYRRLSRINPSPFSAFADFGFAQVVSASPARLLRVSGGEAETRPIAGTRPRGKTSVETARLRTELLLNEKERAEHLMLVDLERSDLGRVCRYGTVHVDDWMALEEYSHVIHIVSNVRGRLSPGIRRRDLLAAVFPGGTITGCPKIRCMEIIEELEPVRRQLYTGSLGYFSAAGDLDLNILIRTAVVHGNRAYVQAGAGIVADSDPGREYEETIHKARAMLELFGSGEPERSELVGIPSGSLSG